MTRFWKLILAIAICQITGLISGFFTFEAISEWYFGLQKPFFAPPNWVFGPVWTTLYLLMGVSLFLVWDKGLKSDKTRSAIKLFGIQLALNFFWSLIFFNLRSPEFAFIEMIFLWFFIFKTIKAFYPISKTAAILLWPYLAWVSFAGILNLSIAVLN